MLDRLFLSAGFNDPSEKIRYETIQKVQAPIVCLILYIFSLDTPLRWYINDSAVMSEQSSSPTKYLRALGPFVKLLFEIIGENLEQVRHDSLKKGMDLHSPKEGRKHPCGFLNQPILLFKFTYLTQQLIDEYIYFLGKSDTSTGAPDYICLPAYASMYPLLSTALSQVDPEEPPEEGLCPVLICLCMTNWQGFDGFRLT